MRAGAGFGATELPGAATGPRAAPEGGALRSTTGAGVLEVQATHATHSQPHNSLRNDRCTEASGNARQQRHELNDVHLLFYVTLRRALDDAQALLATLCDGQNHSTTRAQLLHELARHVSGGCGHDDDIEWRDFGHAAEPVRMSQTDVKYAKLAKMFARF